jgi:hypothetical protein
VAPKADPLRAIAIRPQVALPASWALLTSASLTDAHPPTVTSHPAAPMVTRPADRHMPTPGWFTGQHFDPETQRPGAKRGRNRTRQAGFPVSGEQRRAGSRDRKTPTVPFTLRDQAFDPGEARNPDRRGYKHAVESSFVRAELADQAPYSQSPTRTHACYACDLPSHFGHPRRIGPSVMWGACSACWGFEPGLFA